MVARGTARSAPEDPELDAPDIDQWIGPVSRGTWVEILVDEVTGRRFGTDR